MVRERLHAPALRRVAVARSLHALLWRPWAAVPSAGWTELGRPATAGGGRKRRGGGQQRAEAYRDNLGGDGAVVTFADLWHVLPLRKLVVFGVRRPAFVGGMPEQSAQPVWDFTVAVDDRLHHPAGSTRIAVGFTLGADADARDGATVQAAIARALGRLTWDDFVDPGDGGV